MPIHETIGRGLGKESLQENLCILGITWTPAGEKPEGYNLSYSVSLKKCFCFNSSMIWIALAQALGCSLVPF